MELDYLHTIASPFCSQLPNYVRREDQAYPFYIILSKVTKYPGKTNGLTQFYGFHVYDPIPIIAIPLKDEDICPFDIGHAYHHSYAIDRRARMPLDYSQLPAEFERYSPFDQQRILARMEALRAEEATLGADSATHP